MGPNPNSIYPNADVRQVVYIKNVITRPNKMCIRDSRQIARNILFAAWPFLLFLKIEIKKLFVPRWDEKLRSPRCHPHPAEKRPSLFPRLPMGRGFHAPPASAPTRFAFGRGSSGMFFLQRSAPAFHHPPALLGLLFGLLFPSLPLFAFLLLYAILQDCQYISCKNLYIFLSPVYSCLLYTSWNRFSQSFRQTGVSPARCSPRPPAPPPGGGIHRQWPCRRCV